MKPKVGDRYSVTQDYIDMYKRVTGSYGFLRVGDLVTVVSQSLNEDGSISIKSSYCKADGGTTFFMLPDDVKLFDKVL